MLLYLLFWTILGFIFHFYIIFGTNLLTGGPTQNCCFFAYFRVLKKRNINRSPNGIKPSGTWFSHRTWSRRLGPYCKGSKRWSQGWGAHPTVGARPPISWGPREILDLHSKLSGSDLFRKSCSRRFHSVWSPFDILFLRNSKIGKKQQFWAGPPVNRLVPKII